MNKNYSYTLVNYCKFRTLLKYVRINKNKKEWCLKNNLQYNNPRKRFMFLLLKKDIEKIMMFGNSFITTLMRWCVKYYRCGIIITLLHEIIRNCDDFKKSQRFKNIIENYNREDIFEYINNKKPTFKEIIYLISENGNKNNIIENIYFHKINNFDRHSLSMSNNNLGSDEYFMDFYYYGFYLDFMDKMSWLDFYRLFVSNSNTYFRFHFSNKLVYLNEDNYSKNLVYFTELNKDNYSKIFLEYFQKICYGKLHSNLIQKIKESDRINSHTKLEIKKIIQEEYYAYNRKEIKPILI